MSDIKRLAKEYGLTEWAHGEEYVSKTLVDFAEAYHAEQQRQEQYPSDASIAEAISKIGMSDSRPLGQQWDSVKKLIRQFITPPDQSKLIESQASEIAELKKDRNDLNYLAMDRLHEIEALQSHINVLREALEEARYSCLPDFKEHIDELLASTPSQSLARVIDETIEQCAKVADDCGMIFSVAKSIRALKSKS